jgi:predicted CoA-binding protein
MTNFEQFFSSQAYAVVGASVNREKYGNKVLRSYLQNNLKVFPIHPIQDEIEGLKVFHELKDLPPEVKSISVITSPSVSEKIVEAAALCGIQNIWMQPGAESPIAIQRAKELGLNVIAQGPCILVYLGFHDN